MILLIMFFSIVHDVPSQWQSCPHFLSLMVHGILEDSSQVLENTLESPGRYLEHAGRLLRCTGANWGALCVLLGASKYTGGPCKASRPHWGAFWILWITLRSIANNHGDIQNILLDADIKHISHSRNRVHTGHCDNTPPPVPHTIPCAQPLWMWNYNDILTWSCRKRISPGHIHIERLIRRTHIEGISSYPKTGHYLSELLNSLFPGLSE